MMLMTKTTTINQQQFFDRCCILSIIWMIKTSPWRSWLYLCNIVKKIQMFVKSVSFGQRYSTWYYRYGIICVRVCVKYGMGREATMGVWFSNDYSYFKQACLERNVVFYIIEHCIYIHYQQMFSFQNIYLIFAAYNTCSWTWCFIKIDVDPLKPYSYK